MAQPVMQETACNAGDASLIPELRRPPGEGNGNPLHYSCLENSMDRGAWWATVYGVKRVGHDLATKPPPPYTHETITTVKIMKINIIPKSFFVPFCKPSLSILPPNSPSALTLFMRLDRVAHAVPPRTWFLTMQFLLSHLCCWHHRQGFTLISWLAPHSSKLAAKVQTSSSSHQLFRTRVGFFL